MSRRDMPAVAPLVLRAIALVTPVLAVVATAVAAGHVTQFVVLAVVAGAVLCVRSPDSHLGLVMVVGLAVHWIAETPRATSGWALVVAVALALFHVSLAALSVAPPDAAWTGAMARRWARRTAVVVAATAAMWLLTAALDGALDGSGAVALVLALVALTGATVWARARTVQG